MKVLTAIIAASMLSACASGGPEPFHIGTKPPVRTVDGSAVVSKTMLEVQPQADQVAATSSNQVLARLLACTALQMSRRQNCL